MAYSKTIKDSVGREYPRKNQYIIYLINSSTSDIKKI